MRYIRIYLLIFIILLISGACHDRSPATPIPADFLVNENADIFMLDGIVYSNVQDVDWLQGLEYTIGEQVGEIKKQSNKTFGFSDGTANVLPVGTKIYETDTPVYIAIEDGKEIRYIQMLEG
ncbi:hypothetical protein RGU12_13755 [Fredinandcohnia sp. QZ13]|uniref:hypothetical protein n=1 Tax=Fredinandcohnia sp. QZ13 TaxID=3073144 RepID=UPI0028531DAA|nr:hypothetical protein [Fredinandcohnia sp. QZ13]MDR4888574.1 hypothetical protein [Fredinandcohnia sp. QZ13]